MFGAIGWRYGWCWIWIWTWGTKLYSHAISGGQCFSTSDDIEAGSGSHHPVPVVWRVSPGVKITNRSRLQAGLRRNCWICFLVFWFRIAWQEIASNRQLNKGQKWRQFSAFFVILPSWRNIHKKLQVDPSKKVIKHFPCANSQTSKITSIWSVGICRGLFNVVSHLFYIISLIMTQWRRFSRSKFVSESYRVTLP